ncbi:MAG: EAL domain-containing protein [Pseudomonadota bacterium]
MGGRPTPPGLVALYLRLSAWLVPTFLVLAVIGLTALSRHVVTNVERGVTARVGNLSARVASGLELMGDQFWQDGAVARATGQQLILTLMSDPAIECAELAPPGGTPILRAPQGLGCHARVEGETLTLPVYFEGDTDLRIVWKLDEVALARTRQRELSMVILLFGLMVALLTNWLAFRVIIGRPLHDLVSRVERARVEAEHSALHDALTGLPNRRYLDETLTARCAGDAEVTVLHLDLDGFKPINDTLGHAAGDRVLRHVADSLRKLAAGGEMVARTGGDEFVILAAPGQGIAEAARLADRLIARLSHPIEFEEEHCRVGASVGIASTGADADRGALSGGRRTLTADELLSNADIALYKAKAQGRGRWVAFGPEMRSEAEARRRIADELYEALDRCEFVAHYQPQYDPGGTRIVGLEALARWQHPRRGLLLPADFIEIAEEVALVDQIDQQILRRAIADIAVWQAAGHTVPTVAVNVSAKRLNSPGLMQDLHCMKIPHGQIAFEVLETAYLDRAAGTVLWNLDGLADMGIEIEIDDFGTGRASIASVLALRPARLKVAREIVQAFADEGANRALLSAIVGMGNSLGVGLVAEGVETDAQFRMLAGMGFEKLQGFAFSPARPSDDIAAMLAASAEAQRASG